MLHRGETNLSEFIKCFYKLQNYYDLHHTDLDEKMDEKENSKEQSINYSTFNTLSLILKN